MISSDQLKEYISLGNSSGFYGYGKWASEIYLLGIEEAGCYSESLIQQKINKFYELEFGNEGMFDNKSFQYNLTDQCDPKLSMYSDFFEGKIKKGGYVPKIATFLKVLEDCDLEKYEYVQRKLGSFNSKHSLIEILPLPCPKVSDWFYPKWVNCDELNFMKNKSAYRKEIIQKRTSHIKDKIELSRDKKLILFLADGRDKISYWNQISPIPIENYIQIDGIKFHISKNKMYVVLPFPGSPASNGIFNSDNEIIRIAEAIKLRFKSI
jgi:hypothetical protein